MVCRHENIVYSALVPNPKGFEECVTQLWRDSYLPGSNIYSENINCTIAEPLRCETILHSAHTQNLQVRGYISTIVGCPYQGKVTPNEVLNVSKELLALGCYEISLGDTIGVGTPRQITELLDTLLAHIPAEKVAVHFHNTYGQA